MGGRDYMGIPREKIPWFPTIDEDLCTSCGECLDFCSNDVFDTVNGRTVVAKPYNCVVGCSACQKVCPVGAIAFPSQKELVSTLQELRGQRDAAR